MSIPTYAVGLAGGSQMEIRRSAAGPGYFITVRESNGHAISVAADDSDVSYLIDTLKRLRDGR